MYHAVKRERTIRMKRLLMQDPSQVAALSEPQETDEPEREIKIRFSPTELVDILLQIEELDSTVAIRMYDGALQLQVGDSTYEIDDAKRNRYPKRRLRKLEP